MGFTMNVFRILADCSHALSKCILIFAIHYHRTAEGVSLITQTMYALIFCTRYLDLFWVPPATSLWNFVLKIFYITTSFYILFLMLRVYARSREREKAWKMGAWSLGGSLVLAPLATLVLNRRGWRGPIEMLRSFSLILESVCVLPQLLLLRQTNVPTVIDSYYLLTLGLYRALYVVNWVERSVDDDTWHPEWVAIISGVVQTVLYVDFAWVYYTRQRVKLRFGGGVVDSDDLRRGWLLNRIFGRHGVNADADDDEADGDEESAPALNGHGGRTNGSTRKSKWGARGISVSADDAVLADEREREGLTSASSGERFEDRTRYEHERGQGDVDPDARMQDPDELARALEDDEEEVDEPPAQVDASGVTNGSEWRDAGAK